MLGDMSEFLVVAGVSLLLVSWSCLSLWLDIRRVHKRRMTNAQAQLTNELQSRNGASITVKGKKPDE